MATTQNKHNGNDNGDGNLLQPWQQAVGNNNNNSLEIHPAGKLK